MVPGVVLRAEQVSLHYGEFAALTDVDATVAAGEAVAVVGASGSGKSSLLYCLAGLEQPSGGTVELCGAPVWELSPAERAEVRLSRCGFVFQSADLVPELTLRDNVALPVELLGRRRKEALERADATLDRLAVGAERGRRPAEVSGGQRQRAAVARALVTGPSIVFADEPTGALDSANRESVLELLLDQVRSCSAALLMVTHDQAVAEQTDRVIHLRDGRVEGMLSAAR